MSGDDKIKIFDTTMRDGEQSPGATMNAEEKCLIAELLDSMGVDIIEAGFAIASEGDFDAIRQVAKRVKKATVCSLARAKEGDIRRAAEAVEGAAHPRIHTFISTSPIHIKHQLNMEPQAVLDLVSQSVTLARSLCEDVEWSAMDATRTDIDYLTQAVQRAVDAGATTINIPDTVGYALPDEFSRTITQLRERVRGMDGVTISVHCHNDLGLAVANSLAAVGAGARQIECTINGIGERAGNTALEEIVMALKTRADSMPYQVDIDTTKIMRASRLVSQVTGFAVQNNKAIVGANAFAHESGIHQDGVLKCADTYEIIRPETVGWTSSQLVLGKHSGRHAFKDRLESLGFELGHNALEDAFIRFKELADRKKEVFDDDIISLLGEQMGVSQQARVAFGNIEVTCGGKKATARLTLQVDGQEVRVQEEGDGPVDATFRAIKAAYPHDATLSLYQVNAVTKGIDAQAEVAVRLQAPDGRLVNGNAANTDTIAASATAYISALNRLENMNRLVVLDSTTP